MTAAPEAPEAPPVTEAQMTQRLRRLAKKAERLSEEVEVLRRRRNWGAIALERMHNVKPVLIYRDYLDVARNGYVRITQETPVSGVPDDFPVDANDVDALTEYVKDVAKKFNAKRNKLVEVREERDELITSLANGLEGPQLPKHEIAELTDLTTGRISQITTGTPRVSRRGRRRH